MNIEQFKLTHRHLPHWSYSGSIYFVTFRVKNGTLSEDEKDIVLAHVKEGNKYFYLLIAIVIMLDHVHILFCSHKEYSLSRIMKGIKGVTARQINLTRATTGSIWQDESFDRIIRNDSELQEKFYYMANNPIKAGLVSNTTEYRWWYFNPEIIL